MNLPLGKSVTSSVARAQQGLGIPDRGGRPRGPQGPGWGGTMMGRASRLAPCPCPLCLGLWKCQNPTHRKRGWTLGKGLAHVPSLRF